MRPEVLKRYAGPVPRYTSYPTAPHFSPDVEGETYSGWLARLSADNTLSLYVHIPYCHELCWYCGCTTKATKRYEPVARYLPVLMREIESVASCVDPRLKVSHIHWGGGSPNVLSPDDIRRLADHMRRHFKLAPQAEFAIEVDPRVADEDTIRAFAEAGVNRVSIGVQDFDLSVQKAINRMQSFEKTRDVVAAFRSYGIRSLNIDLVYGLPHQTRDSVRDTVFQVLKLQPDRIAMFGYAHLPQKLKQQRLIDSAALPDIEERFAQSNRAASILQASGYLRVGLDHFVQPNDRLAKAEVRRNFQGYTDDVAPVLLGFGASAIGRLPQGYVQNAPDVGEYVRRIQEQGRATVRGHAMTDDDVARGFAIERLMCDLRFPAEELRRNFGEVAAPVLEEAADFLEMENDGLVERDPEDGGIFRITEKGRLFVRSICSVFDRYLDTGRATVGSQGI